MQSECGQAVKFKLRTVAFSIAVTTLGIGVLFSLWQRRGGDDAGQGEPVLVSPVGTASAVLPMVTVNPAAAVPVLNRPGSPALLSLRPAKYMDWARLPQGLGDLVQESLRSEDGTKAYLAARALAECQTLPKRLSVLEQAIQSQQDLSVQRQLKNEYEEGGRVKAQCQSVQGDPEAARLQLLVLAAAKATPGATADLIASRNVVPDAEQWTHIAADAEGGDLHSLAQILSAGQATSGVADSVYAGYKLALVQIANDVELKSIGSATLELVGLLRATAPYGESKMGRASGQASLDLSESKYRQDGLAVATAARVLTNVRKSMGVGARPS